MLKTKESLCQLRKNVTANCRGKKTVDSYNIHLVQVTICMQIYDFDVITFNKEILAFQL